MSGTIVAEGELIRASTGEIFRVESVEDLCVVTGRRFAARYPDLRVRVVIESLLRKIEHLDQRSRNKGENAARGAHD